MSSTNVPPRPKKGADVPTKLSSVLDCKQGAVRAVRFNVDGNYCLTCGSDKTLKLWNPVRRILLKTYTGHGYEVLDADGSCDNSQLVSCGMDKAVIVWDVSAGTTARVFRGHAGTVNCVRFNEDSSVVVSGGLDGQVKCWDVKSRRMEPIQTLEECKDSVTALDMSDHEILVGSADGKVRRYDLRNGQLMTDYIGTAITSVSFTHDGQCVLVSSNGESVKLLDKSSGEMLSEYQGHINKNYRIEAVLNNTDHCVLSGSENGFVYIWDLVEGTLLHKLDHSDPVKKVEPEPTASSTGSLVPDAWTSNRPSQSVVHSLTFHPKNIELLTAVKGKVFRWTNDLAQDEG
ncbi:hypothetical protein TCAL_05271 [Tigriopus californicus]|uniref:WD repeat domain-containing protein 83 n=1 Tax=Tigriopus californicus TaxID=6832 RepID=A0A553NR02_TIGCA|nr:WD repeat domain-containing protein 83-like [Tigriopus californicus]TRY67854.1 hypothetical protein TCAL_05271 [Tigriopus californicus]|eukprot:TCALIF_05271-PA protein Name:"Similar to wdr83 WD repeat domain-containing protein 83 (Danio rerio)" AED:0.01 eAED:0.03 QI:0/-1/0/1/-1/1/1/0/344